MKVETFALERWMTRWETKARFDIAESGVFPMTTSELLAIVPESAREETLESLLSLRLGYTEARGTQALRQQVASTYDNVSPEQVLITTGAIEANYLVFTSLLSAGDHVVAVFPAYQQLYSVANAVGCEVTRWNITEGPAGYEFDLDELDRLVTSRTRMIVINTPHNPTGAILTASDLERIYLLAESIGALVLCDEAYRWLDLPGEEPLAPPMRNLGTNAMSVGTVSKPFGLPGLRIGWIAATEDIVQTCWSARDYVSLSPAGLSDFLATIALRQRHKIIERTKAIVGQNLCTADEWFAVHGDVATWRRPRAGLLALVRYALSIPSHELADILAGQYSVMLAPGSAFGYEGHLRLGIGQDPPIFAEGLRRTVECFHSFKATNGTEPA
jgi:aspartate/methionine/tyrosine aminotransferase